MTRNELGAYLRARRGQVTPEHVGMPSWGQRRVAGLRREEVAVLAGMNADYYTRLEQGRERSPSPQVLDALARALLLDAEARDHLYRLAGHAVQAPPPGPAKVSAALQQLLDGYAHTPAFVIDRTLDLLAYNTLARELYSPFAQADNLARMTFLDPAARAFHEPWDAAARATVAALRQASAYSHATPRLHELVDELKEAGGEFEALWNSHTVHGKAHGTKHLVHPAVGALVLTYHGFDVRAAPGQQLVVYHAAPGSDSAQKLSLLGSLAASTAG